jgi:aminoglycoside 6'-N-acetyltransferase I
VASCYLDPVQQARPPKRADLEEIVRMRKLLFPSCPDDQQRAELEVYFASTPRAPGTVGNEGCFVVERPDAEIKAGAPALCGFAEVMLRSHAEGAWEHTTRGRLGIAVLEAWWVDPDARRKGVGEALVSACEKWAREQGSPVLASDAELDNLDSHAAHQRLGFEEAGRLVCFIKPLDP